jgi:hypothetical protein
MSQGCPRVDRHGGRECVWHPFRVGQRALPRRLVPGRHNGVVAGSEGTPTPRGGARRAPKPKRTVQPRLLLLGLASFVALIGWALLVWVAIGFGRDARGGESGQWGQLLGTSLAAVVCLFVSLWLGTTLLRRAGILEHTPKAPAKQEHRH